MVRKREDGLWEGRAVVEYDDKGLSKTKNVLAQTKHECQEKLTELMETVGCTESEKICADMPFREWMDFWHQTYIKSGLRPSAQSTYESTIYQNITGEDSTVPAVPKGSSAILRLPKKGGMAHLHRTIWKGLLRPHGADVSRQMPGGAGPGSAGEPDPDQRCGGL